EITAKRPREALLAEADKARLSKQLVTLQCDVPVTIALDEMKARTPDYGKLIPVLRELEFTDLVRTLTARAVAGSSSGTAAQAAPEETVGAPKAPDGRYEIAATPDAVAAVVREARAAGVIGLEIQG